MFVDKVKVTIQAGHGGDGKLSFRHEKFIARGGPDGGDGGNGGAVILIASRNQDTLAAFRYQKRLAAESGEAGGKQRRHGKSGQDLAVLVPVGTLVMSEKKETLADLTEDEQQVVIAKGGKGGFGNAHFTSSTRQAPRIAEKGEPGEQLTATLELKMIADVGLVGLPNAGKSTLLAAVSQAHPQIADYPFTTLKPNLGVADIDERTSLLFADIPGLIEGASQGKGLGDEFLRHIERTKVLIHLIDAYQDDVTAAYRTIQDELQAYAVDLTKRPQIVVLNKIDGLAAKTVTTKIKALQAAVPSHTRVLAISATSRQGLPELLYAIKELVKKQRRSTRKLKQDTDLPVLRLPPDESTWQVIKRADHFVVKGAKIEAFARRTDFSNPHAVQRLRAILSKMGIQKELERRGIQPGQSIMIGSDHLEY